LLVRAMLVDFSTCRSFAHDLEKNLGLLLPTVRGKSNRFRILVSDPVLSEEGILESTVTLDELSYSFNAALESLGDVVKDVIYSTLEKKGIGVHDIPLRIPDVMLILQNTVGATAGLIVRNMLNEFRRARFKARMLRKREDHFRAETQPS
jgi:hypothetical protein